MIIILAALMVWGLFLLVSGLFADAMLGASSLGRTE